MKRKLFTVFIALVLGSSLLLAACAAPAPPPAPAPAPAPAPLPEVTWNVICHQSSHEVLPMPQLAAFVERVAERTDGRFKIQVAIEGELGIHRDLYNEALASGILELAAISSPTMERVIPSVGIHHLPQVAVTREGWQKVWEALADYDTAKMKKVGYQLVAPDGYYVEWNQELFASKPIADLTDLSGVKVRTWQVTMEEEVASLGGEAVYMSFDEVYMAMQRGVMDAYFNGLPASVGISAWEIASDIYLVGHPGGMEWLVVSTKAFETLPDEYKTILIEEAPKWGEDCRTGIASAVENALDTYEEHGTQIHELSPAERDAWRKAALNVWTKWAASDPTNAEALEMAKKAMGL